jgi:hypothetical protein
MGSVLTMREPETVDSLLTAEEVALMLKVSKDWVGITRPGDCRTYR